MLVRFRKELHFLVSSPDLLILLFFFTKDVVRSFEVELLSLIVLGLFKSRATAVLSWLDCSSTVHDTSTTWFQTSNLIQSNTTAVAENKTQKRRKRFRKLLNVF